MQNWRWDQGRQKYFRFDNIKNIARCLVALEGASLRPGGPDPLRSRLMFDTGLPFSPGHYKVWRNYGRVFECCLLATEVSNALVVTDVCRRLADSTSSPVDVDEYLSFLVPRFYHPAPMFQDYNPTAQQYFSFCAVLKYLLAAYQEQGQEPSLSLNDVFSLIIGNNCVGTEPLGFYKTLRPTGHLAQGDQSRQVRESLAFISQSSFLKWHRNRLYLDILSGDTESVQAFEPMMNPIVQPRNYNQANEIIEMGKDANIAFLSSASSARRQPADVLFTEGKRVRVTHLRTERSPILRDAFFKHLLKPYLCDMCACNPKTRIPGQITS